MPRNSGSVFSKLSVKSHSKWFQQLPEIKSEANETQPPDLVTALIAEAENLLQSETNLYRISQQSRSDTDFVWIERILREGTLSDKISARSLLIKDAPVYNISSIETLVNMVTIKGKVECGMATDALRDLFIGEILAEDRKLKYFHQQPLKDINSITEKSPAVRRSVLILWLFEDKAKNLYSKFVNNLKDVVRNDTVEKSREKAISVMCKLLKENPEQEQFLLEQIVNKIGDPVGKIASSTCFLLQQVLNEHPAMKTVIVQEVERFVFRENLSDRAKHYALCFLNQIIFTQEDYELANHLIMIYFSQFKLFVRKGEVQTRMMSALLTGVSRAYPYAKLKDNNFMDQLDAMYRLVHVVSYNKSIQAMMLIFQVLDSKDNLSDRFYNSLYRKLLDPAVSTSTRQQYLLNLVYRALKKDVAVVRVKAFIKRILQVALYQAPNLQCAFLIMISELCKLHPHLLEVKHVIMNDSDSEEHYDDVPDEDEKLVVQNMPADIKPKIESSWVHNQNRRVRQAYDIFARNALHSGAEYTSPWELIYLKKSFHPAVSLYAHQICNSSPIKYNGDPLLDFTITRFLDRFVYRNPKKPPEKLVSNVEANVFGKRRLLKAKAKEQVPIYKSDCLHRKAEKIPPEEAFIYEYLRNQASHFKESKHEEDDSDIESVSSDEFEKILEGLPTDDGNDSFNFAKELSLQKQKKGSKRKVDSGSEDKFNEEEDQEIDSDLDDEVPFDAENMNEAFGDFDEDLSEADFNIDSDLDDDDEVSVDAEELNEAFSDFHKGLAEADLNNEHFAEMGSNIKKPSKKKRKVTQLAHEKLLASAEEFSTLLEDNADSKVDTITSNAFINKDKSDAKQLAWEIQQDRFVKGLKYNKKVNYGKKSFGKKSFGKKNFGKKNSGKKNFRKNTKSKR